MPRVGLSDTESSHINPMYNLIYMQSPISCSLSSVDAGVNLGLPKLLQFIRGPAIYFLNLKTNGTAQKNGPPTPPLLAGDFERKIHCWSCAVAARSLTRGENV